MPFSSLEIRFCSFVVRSIREHEGRQMTTSYSRRSDASEDLSRPGVKIRSIPQVVDEFWRILAETKRFWIPLNFETGQTWTMNGTGFEDLINVNTTGHLLEPTMGCAHDEDSKRSISTNTLSCSREILTWFVEGIEWLQSRTVRWSLHDRCNSTLPALKKRLTKMLTTDEHFPHLDWRYCSDQGRDTHSICRDRSRGSAPKTSAPLFLSEISEGRTRWSTNEPYRWSHHRKGRLDTSVLAPWRRTPAESVQLNQSMSDPTQSVEWSTNRQPASVHRECLAVNRCRERIRSSDALRGTCLCSAVINMLVFDIGSSNSSD